jgi:hypothetical protein
MSKTGSKSGPTYSRAKTFTVGIVVVKLAAIMFYKRNMSSRSPHIIDSMCEYATMIGKVLLQLRTYLKKCGSKVELRHAFTYPT